MGPAKSYLVEPKSTSHSSLLSSLTQEMERERVSLQESHARAMEESTYEHQGELANHQQELRKKLLYEYSKQDKLEAQLKEMQLTLDRCVEAEISSTHVNLANESRPHQPGNHQ